MRRRALDREHRRAGLRVPAAEGVGADGRGGGGLVLVGVGHCGAEVVARDGLPVVARKVEVHALAEALLAQQRAVHTDHLRALVVHGDGVEVVHRDVRLGSDRVRHRARVLHKLRRADGTRLLDPTYGGGGHILREVLVAEHGQTFLKRQLEPVAARDAVAAPVVEILVRDDALHALVVGIRRGRRFGEDGRGVEDVEALVLHRAHVEVVHRDDVVHVEVVLAAVRLLVPLHRVLERLHRPVELVDVVVLRPQGEAHRAPRARREAALDAAQVARDRREQVRRLRERVDEARPVSAATGVAAADFVAVREEDRVLCLVGFDADLIFGHHVGPILEVGDPPEALGLALRAKVARRFVQPRELRVLLRLDRHNGRQREGGLGQTEQR
mmetsp:Transcript_2979/g.6751  ORF Transcript_2979/g.6751 Transcript_2979/m.6751 type:complete len:385 (+) Transcript_2979:1746-2900(+)